MNRRINIMLPETTIGRIDRMAKSGERSRFIQRAVEHYISTQSAEAVQKRLEAALTRDADTDAKVSAEWAVVDNETWQQLDDAETRASQPPETR